MAAPEERLLSDGEGGALGSARLSPPPVSEPPEALAPLEPPPQSNTLMGLPIVAIESILSFLSYDETSQLRLVGPGEGRRRGGRARGPAAAGARAHRGKLASPAPGLEKRWGGAGCPRPRLPPAGRLLPPGKGRGAVGWGFLPSPLPARSLGHRQGGVCRPTRFPKGPLTISY